MAFQLDRAYLAARPAKAFERALAVLAFEGRPLTARARWLDPLARAVLATTRALPALAAVRAPLYVIGSGRSGTTWLAKALSLHPEVGFLNEPRALWHAAFPDEDLVGNRSRGAARLYMDERDADDTDAGERARAVLRRGYGAFLRLSGSRRVLDKYPELVFRVPFVRTLFPDARFLLVVRRGADACRSVAAWSARRGTQRGTERHDWWGRDGRKYRVLVEQGAARHEDLAPLQDELCELSRDVDRAALEWILAMRSGLSALARHPDAVLRVDYEALLAGPRAVLERVLDFAGLAHEGRVLAYAERTARPVGPEGAVTLAECLRAPFEATQCALG